MAESSPSSSLKILKEKNQVINKNFRTNRVVDSKNNMQANSNSYVLYDTQKVIKNLKIVSNKENPKNLVNDYKIKINKKSDESPINNDIKKNKTIKIYYKK